MPGACLRDPAVDATLGHQHFTGLKVATPIRGRQGFV